jgi:hypothetical protein
MTALIYTRLNFGVWVGMLLAAISLSDLAKRKSIVSGGKTSRPMDDEIINPPAVEIKQKKLNFSGVKKMYAGYKISGGCLSN